jgi:hypothetical protein
MTIELADFITYDEVRTTVGLSVDELPDSVLALPIYAVALELELDGVNLTADAPGPGPLKTRYLLLEAMSTMTTDQQKLYNLTRMFCAYAVAAEVATSLSMRTPKIISDSKASLTRFSPEATFKDTIEALKLKLKGLKDSIESINTGSATNYAFMFAIKPVYDPISGESI